MNLPNKLTISRIILTFIFMVFLFLKGAFSRYIALSIFIVASLTDFYDGRIARRKNLVTNFGKLIDPIADKILVLAPFLAFVELRVISAWMVVLVIIRDLIITGLRLFAASQGKVLAATELAKHKTASQMSAILLILIFLALKETEILGISKFIGQNESWFDLGIFILMLTVVTLTLFSGILYLWKNRSVLLSARYN